jgi:hypothetical protein
MASALSFSCSCGSVAGELTDAGPAKGDRVVCHCTDCQNFARHLGADGRILQAHGGTDLYQGRCAQMRLTTGKEKLACLHLTDKPTLRWYSSCCRTPMFNTYANGRIPYLTTFLANCDREKVETVLGPAVGHLSLPAGTAEMMGVPRMSLGKLMRRFFGRMMKDLVSGDHRRSALFDPKTLAPISAPHRLTEAESGSLARYAQSASAS